MVSDYSDAGPERWLANAASTCCAAAAGSPARARSRSTASATRADHVVLATGADPFIPPVPGLRELEGVWSTREATSMKAVPRRLIVLGGGPAGVELAQVVRRFGGEVALVEGAPHLLAREAAPLGEALGEAFAPRRHRARARRAWPPPRGARASDFVLELDDGRELRGDRLLVATGRRPRVEGIGLETVGIEANPRGIPVDAHLRAAENACGRSAT